MIKAAGSSTLLTGHVHHSAELEFEGIRQFTIGEGLGHENIVLQRPVAKMMMGQVEAGKEPVYDWVDLNIPWSYLHSPTHEIKLRKDGRLRQLQWFQELMTNSQPG